MTGEAQEPVPKWRQELEELLEREEGQFLAAKGIALQVQKLFTAASHYVMEFDQMWREWNVDEGGYAVQRFYNRTWQEAFGMATEAGRLLRQINSAGQEVQAQLLSYFSKELVLYFSSVNELLASFKKFGFVVEDKALEGQAAVAQGILSGIRVHIDNIRTYEASAAATKR